MKYAVWFARLVFAGWVIPAGLNHFIPLFPQPIGNEPLSTELFVALRDSHLFDLVKAVELIAGIGVLTGLYLPLALVVCMPVSFTVWYWDTALQGWGTVSAIYGWAVLLFTLFLALAYFDSYRAMFGRSEPRGGAAQTALRILFGAALVLGGLNHFLGPLVAEPTGSEPLALQLLGASRHSGLLDVVMGIAIAAGALIIAGVAVPFALAVAMPLGVCALFWALVLDRDLLLSAVVLAALAANAALMVARLGAYRGVLAQRALAAGETEQLGENYDGLYMHFGPRAAVPAGTFIAAATVLLAAMGFYWYFVPSVTGTFARYVILVPAALLLLRGTSVSRATA